MTKVKVIDKPKELRGVSDNHTYEHRPGDIFRAKSGELFLLTVGHNGIFTFNSIMSGRAYGPWSPGIFNLGVEVEHGDYLEKVNSIEITLPEIVERHRKEYACFLDGRVK